MTILVCPLALADDLCRACAATHAVSLLGHDAQPPAFDLPGANRLHLRFNDIAEPKDGLVHPTAEHIDALIAFFHGWDRRSLLLIHCWAGVSRSTAAAFIAANLRDGPGHEADLAARLRHAAPFATPNPLMIALADQAMAREGAMVGAIAAIGRGTETAIGAPFEL